MESILLGLLGAGIGAGLFCLGLAAGLRFQAGGRSAGKLEASVGIGGEGCTEPQAEEKRLQEEQEAFAALMRYSADTAYGSRGN